MVHLDTTPLAKSFATQLEGLKQSIASEWHPALPDAGFVEWAISQTGSTIDLGVEPLDFDTISEHRWSEAPTLAAVGFRLHAVSAHSAVAKQWLKGMKRLMTRNPIPSDRNSFFFSPLALLGLATGSRTVVPTDALPLNWLRETITAHADLLPTSTTWSRTLVGIAAQEVGAQPIELYSGFPRDLLGLATVAWLNLSGIQIPETTTPNGMLDICRQLLEVAATTEIELQWMAQRSILLLSLHHAVIVAIGGLELHSSNPTDFVANICRRFPLYIEELKRRYNKRESLSVADEYDLQDLLRSTLKLHFDDVRQEEWNPSYGGAQSRSDLLLKPERVVIEIKMTRTGLTQRKLIEQLTVDKAQYKGHPDCETLICFVYDPGHHLGNPSALEQDLAESTDGMRTLVVVAPQGL